MITRDAFLKRVRDSVGAGNHAGHAPKLPTRGKVGYQGAGTDPVKRFCDELRAAGGFPQICPTPADIRPPLLALLQKHQAKQIYLSCDGLIEKLGLESWLRAEGFNILTPRDLTTDQWREPVFRCEVAISNATHLIAETGTLVMASSPSNPRSLSLLPPVHIVVAERSQLLPDLFDLFDLFSPTQMPACVSLITGPSKTGDIELKLVTGVHGPGELHVLLLA